MHISKIFKVRFEDIFFISYSVKQNIVTGFIKHFIFVFYNILYKFLQFPKISVKNVIWLYKMEFLTVSFTEEKEILIFIVIAILYLLFSPKWNIKFKRFWRTHFTIYQYTQIFSKSLQIVYCKKWTTNSFFYQSSTEILTEVSPVFIEEIRDRIEIF